MCVGVGRTLLTNDPAEVTATATELDCIVFVEVCDLPVQWMWSHCYGRALCLFFQSSFSMTSFLRQYEQAQILCALLWVVSRKRGGPSQSQHAAPCSVVVAGRAG